MGQFEHLRLEQRVFRTNSSLGFVTLDSFYELLQLVPEQHQIVLTVLTGKLSTRSPVTCSPSTS